MSAPRPLAIRDDDLRRALRSVAAFDKKIPPSTTKPPPSLASDDPFRRAPPSGLARRRPLPPPPNEAIAPIVSSALHTDASMAHHDIERATEASPLPTERPTEPHPFLENPARPSRDDPLRRAWWVCLSSVALLSVFLLCLRAAYPWDSEPTGRARDESVLFEFFVPWDFSKPLFERRSTTLEGDELRGGFLRAAYLEGDADPRPKRPATTDVWVGMERLARARRVECLCAPEVGVLRHLMVLRDRESDGFRRLYNCVAERDPASLAATDVLVSHRSLFPEREAATFRAWDRLRLACPQDVGLGVENPRFSSVLAPETSWCAQLCLRLLEGRSVYDE